VQFKGEKFQKEYKSYIEGFGTVLAKYEELIVARKQFAPFLKVRRCSLRFVRSLPDLTLFHLDRIRWPMARSRISLELDLRIC